MKTFCVTLVDIITVYKLITLITAENRRPIFSKGSFTLKTTALLFVLILLLAVQM